MLARRLQHATGRGVDHSADAARLRVERILTGHDNSLEDDSHQAIADRRRIRRRATLFALQNQGYHALPGRSSAGRALMHRRSWRGIKARLAAEAERQGARAPQIRKSRSGSARPCRSESLLDEWSTDRGRCEAAWSSMWRRAP